MSKHSHSECNEAVRSSLQKSRSYLCSSDCLDAEVVHFVCSTVIEKGEKNQPQLSGGFIFFLQSRSDNDELLVQTRQCFTLHCGGIIVDSENGTDRLGR